mgnify:CR=1 FL=1
MRLNPVEIRNRALINDPAFSGYRVEGRAKSDDGYDKKRPDIVELRYGGFEYSVLQDGTLRLDSYDGSASDALIPSKIDGKSVVAFGAMLFRDCETLERVSVESSNELFSTDGLAVFSKDGKILVRLAAPVAEYFVPEGCELIGDHAFDSAERLERVHLPESLVRIGKLAFAKSGVREVVIPPSVETIEDRAFFSCRNLVSCELSNGLRMIGEGAFSLTAVESFYVPESVECIGRGAFGLTPAQKRVEFGAIAIAPENRTYHIDEKGGLYVSDALVELIGDVDVYAIRPGTRVIADRACCRHGCLRSIEVPEGVRAIGDEAFRGARMLREVGLPESLESIGDAAFMDTDVSVLRLSRNVRRIGRSALLVQGEGMMKSSHPLESVDLDEGNPVFYLESGLLCERGGGDASGDSCLLYLGPQDDVEIPDAVNRIAPFAFCGACGINRVVVHGHLHSICASALSTRRSIPYMRVECQRPSGAHEWEEFRIPSLTTNFRVQTLLFGTDGNGTVFNYSYYDSWVTHSAAIDEFAPAAVARLRSGIYLDEHMRGIYRGIVSHRASKVCRYLANVGDIDSIEFLVEDGALTLEEVAMEANRSAGAGDAQLSAYLFELKHRFGAPSGIDFSL